jgi:hypothetical protein
LPSLTVQGMRKCSGWSSLPQVPPPSQMGRWSCCCGSPQLDPSKCAGLERRSLRKSAKRLSVPGNSCCIRRPPCYLSVQSGVLPCLQSRSAPEPATRSFARALPGTYSGLPPLPGLLVFAIVAYCKFPSCPLCVRVSVYFSCICVLCDRGDMHTYPLCVRVNVFLICICACETKS